MPFKQSKDSGHSGQPAWTLEPDPVDESVGSLSNMSYTGHSQLNGGPPMGFYSTTPQPYLLRAAGENKPASPRRVMFDEAQQIAGSQWQGGGTPPMGVKRKNKKDKKKKDKKAKNKETKISVPINVRHVGMNDAFRHGNPASQHSNFTVEHLATMPVQGQLNHISPYESIRKVRDLVQHGDVWTQEIILCISPTELTIKDGSTRNSLNTIPLCTIGQCNYIQDSKGNVLMLTTQDSKNSLPKMHFFQCASSSAEVISNEIKLAISRSKDEESKKKKGHLFGNRKLAATVEQQSLSENWILESRGQSPVSPGIPPRPTEVPPSPPISLSSASQLSPPAHSPPPPPPTQPPPPSVAGAQVSSSPALEEHPKFPHSPSGSHVNVPAISYHAGGSVNDLRDDASIASGSTGTPNQRRQKGDFVSKASNKYVSSVHSRPAKSNKIDNEIKRTMKASRIQRDVDILNHVIDDLEEFMRYVKDKAAAWNELEKRSKKSKRKKHDAALEVLRKRAEPPTEQEFFWTFQKCKYGINQISKLGHHLSSPSPAELLRGIFGYIHELVNLNKGPQLASSVASPLFSTRSIDFMNRKLQPKDQGLWNQLGANWFLTSEQWPAGRPLPPEYEVHFLDGCVPPNLHNSSDCPSNFPTLDTLRREQRGADYSDTYDGDQPDGETGLMIPLAVMQAVADKASMISTPILPSFLVKKHGESSSSINRSQLSLNSVASQDTDVKMAKVLYDYQACTLEEISVYRGEKVEVLDDSRKWWQVKNKFNATGYLPSTLMEVIPSRKRSISGDAGDQNMIDYHGRHVPTPPKMVPPPIPSPANSRRPSLSNVKYSPQMTGQGRKISQPQKLSTLLEVSESRTSTISRPAPNLLPPPTFSPAAPQTRNGIPFPPGVPPPLGIPGAPPAPPVVPGVPPPPFGGPGAPPLPPPPPPVVAPTPQTNLSDMIAQHKLKSAQQGKVPQKKVLNKDKQIDIAAALKKRKPLRKTSTAINLEGVSHSDTGGGGLESELLGKLRTRKLSNVAESEETDNAYQVLPWKANKEEMKQWLTSQGYGGCVDKVACNSGQGLYEMGRGEMKNMFGAGDGIRLFSQLQKDKTRAQNEGGASKESEFQKLMKARKAAADDGAGKEAGLVRKWGKKQTPTNDDTAAAWKQNLKKKLTEKETILDDTLPKRRGQLTGQDTFDLRGRTNKENSLGRSKRYSGEYSDDESYRRGRHVSFNREEDDRRGRRRKERRHRDNDYDEEYDSYDRRRDRDRRGKRRKSEDRNRRSVSSAYSDDEEYREHGNRRRNRRKRDSRSLSDYDSEPERRDKRNEKHKKRGPTNIDDFDEDDYSDSSESYSSDYTDSDYSGSESDDNRQKMRSSVSASELTNAAWALTGKDEEIVEVRIKSQQEEIKKQLASLAQIQKQFGNNSLPEELQKTLQQDLQKLETLQTKLKNEPGNQPVQMQLLGQQMLLCEHLRETHQELEKQRNQSSQNVRLQMLQQQQQAIAAEQQRWLLYEQQQALAQHQLLAAEQQRQFQMAQLQPQPMLSPQSHYGLASVPQVYNPYLTTVGYY